MDREQSRAGFSRCGIIAVRKRGFKRSESMNERPSVGPIEFGGFNAPTALGRGLRRASIERQSGSQVKGPTAATKSVYVSVVFR